MDSGTNEQDSLYNKASREEIEEALRWLEELSDKNLYQPADKTDLPKTVKAVSEDRPASPSETTELPSDVESPFYGILDTSEDDLPEWLREISTTSTMAMLEGGEMESRLDWLAKMAKRESIEELPTLEWRRFSSPLHEMPLPKEEPEAVTEIVAPQVSGDTTAAEVPGAEGSLDLALTREHLQDTVPQESAVAEPEFGETKSFDDLDAAMAWIEELAASQDAPIEDLPSVADRALASKLMLEVGLESQAAETPPLPAPLSQLDDFESHPTYSSDEDPADTVVLMETIAAESGRGISEPEDEPGQIDAFAPELIVTDDILEAKEQPLEIVQPSEEESLSDGADAIDEVVMLAAILVDEPEVSGAIGSSTGEDIADDEFELPDSMVTTDDLAPSEPPTMTFEEAIAYLEGIAQGSPETEQPLELDDDLFAYPVVRADSPPEVLTIADEDETNDRSADEKTLEEADHVDEDQIAGEVLVIATIVTDSADQETEDQVAEDLRVVVTEATYQPEPDLNGSGVYPLEVKLLAIDALAFPVGRRLDDFTTNLGQNQTTSPLPGDLLSAVDWLEMALEEQTSDHDALSPEIADEDLIQMMPEDPDEALAWLVRMANDELDDRPTQHLPVTDADEAPSRTAELIPVMTAEGISTTTTGGIETDLMLMPEDPDEAMAWLESLVEVKSGETSQLEEVGAGDQIAATTTPAPVIPTTTKIAATSRRPTRKTGSGTAWIDLLKPLEK